jgi:hypothetical protein
MAAGMTSKLWKISKTVKVLEDWKWKAGRDAAWRKGAQHDVLVCYGV